MKRLMATIFATLILFGALSGSVYSLNRPWSELDPGESTTNGDHPWGGDNVTPGGGNTTTKVTIEVTLTGFGPIDAVLRVFYLKSNASRHAVRYSRSTETNQSTVITGGTTTNPNPATTNNNSID